MTDDAMNGFVPYEGPIELDPNDYFELQHIASGRVGYFADADDQQTSTTHRVGHFWAVQPRHGRPDFISYLETFAEAPRGPGGAFEFPDTRQELDRAWAAMDTPAQHLTPHHRDAYVQRSSKSLAHGSVHYDPAERTWTIHIATSLAGDAEFVREVRQRFTVDRHHMRVVPRDDFEGTESELK